MKLLLVKIQCGDKLKLYKKPLIVTVTHIFAHHTDSLTRETMVEPNLHGYYQIKEQRFLVKKGEGESRNLLLFFSFIYEPSNRSSLSSPPSLVLDRRT
jgi:hypothetical protein